MKKRILFVDNDIDFAETWMGVLKDNGYEVTIATSAEEADEILTNTWVHLMIIDVRLRDETDRKDKSGLIFAKKEEYRYVNKIIMTKYAHHEVVREAMRARGSVAPAIDFLAKEEGKDRLLRIIGEAFNHDIVVNWNLEIGFNGQSPVSFLHLAELIEPGLDSALIPERAREIEDLFRRLFSRERQLRIDSMLWQGGGRVALSVFAHAGQFESFVVVCGPYKSMEREAQQFLDCSNSATNGRGTMLNGSSVNMRFAANAYLPVGVDLTSVHTLTELYRSGSFDNATESLFQEALAPGFDEKYISEHWDSMNKLCRARFGLGEIIDNPEEFEKRLQALAEQAPRLDMRIEPARGELTLRFGEHAIRYPDPLIFLWRDFEFPILVNTPVIVSGERVLTDGAGKAWLCDYANAGPIPIYWNFTAVESIIRFDWIETTNMRWLHDLEKCLITGFTVFEISDLEQPLRKPAQAIQSVRRLADSMIGHNHSIYYWGLLFEATRRLMGFNTESLLTKNDLARPLHAMIAAAVISDKLSQPAQHSHSTAGSIDIDKENHIVFLQGQSFRMRPGQSYDLLCYLFDHQGQLVTPREIIENVFKEPYREKDRFQSNKIYVSIDHLRKMIRDELDPQYLFNEPGGYRLIISP